MHVKHAWNSVPMNWESLGPPPVGTTINLHIFLKLHHENALIDALYEVSNPEHVKYGAHLTREQVAELLAPHPDTLELVSLWLEHRGVSSSIISTTQGGSWLTLTGVPVPQANDLLGASFQLYQHTETNDIVLRTVSYALPTVLHAHVDTVVPTTYFGTPHVQIKTPRVQRNDTAAVTTKVEFEEPATLLSSRDEDIVPSFLRSLYKTENYIPAAAGRNVLGTLNGGGYDPSSPGIEGNLNIEYASAMAYPTPNVYFSVGRAWEDPYIAWLHNMLNLLIVPQTIVATALSARGVSVLFSSGNLGVGPDDCTVTDSFGNVYVHDSPPPRPRISGPYVTTVGGTTSKDPEIAASLSGGGFSNYFPRPDYQDKAMEKTCPGLFLRCTSVYSSSAEGRGYPDISAQALDFITISQQQLMLRSGTSCATPTVGKPPLGFLNPWLYGGGLAGLNDITSGSNPGCGTNGFPAIVEWDPVTGLGTPNFEKLLRIVENMEK
ncbi:peptidase S8/S53 domain-containing protein [Lactarius quietus]|nr:peptidase S8/S53 domain-containing protein [Lactarius quietus]